MTDIAYERRDNMTRNIPAAGEFYRHFKGNIYQIKSIAKDSETGEKLVVYQAMYPPFDVWVRSLDMFMSETDCDKYPECSQKFRFEKIVFGEESFFDEKSISVTKSIFSEEKIYSMESKDEKENINKGENISDEELKKLIINGQAEKLTGRISNEEIGQRGFMEILDAQSCHEKYQLFAGLENYLDERLLSNIAVAFDIVLTDGTEKEHYDTILDNLRTRDRYEDRRLR